MTTIEPKEQLVKVTVLLPKDTIDKLDTMAAKALMGSRGRVIQSIVDSLWDSQSDLQVILNTINFLQSKPQLKSEEVAGVLFVLLFPMGNVVTRVNKYLGVSLSPPVPQVQSQPVGSALEAGALGRS